MGKNVTDKMREKSTKFEQLKGVISQDYPELQGKLDIIINDLECFLSNLNERCGEGTTIESYKEILDNIKNKERELNILDSGGDLAYVYFDHPDANIVKQSILYDIVSHENELRQAIDQVDPDIRSGMSL